MEQLRFAVLGPVRAWRGAVEVDLGPPQQRAVLAALLLAEGTQVSMGELIDAVWGTRAPVSAAGTLRTYVHRLRKVLGPVGESVSSVLQSLGRGYRLHIGQVRTTSTSACSTGCSPEPSTPMTPAI
jgi:DNA-binding SARP family transcriptional activator